MPRHVAEVPVRWSDVDQLGRVNDVAFLRFLQEARVAMLFVDTPERGATDLARGVVVHRHEIAYRVALAARRDPVRVETWVRRLGAASFELGYEVMDDDRTVYAVASSTLVPYDLADGRPRRVSRADRTVLEGFVDDGPAPGVDVAQSGNGAAHVTKCAVRFDDLDSYGHVNNVVIAEYAQQAARDFVAAQDRPDDYVGAGMSVDYLAPIPFRSEPLEVVVRGAVVGASSIEMAVDVRDADTVFAQVGCTVRPR